MQHNPQAFTERSLRLADSRWPLCQSTKGPSKLLRHMGVEVLRGRAYWRTEKQADHNA